MTEQTNYVNAAFMEVTSKKVEAQDKKILAIEEKIKTNPENTELMRELISMIDTLKKDLNAFRLQENKLNELYTKLDNGIAFLKQPLQNKVVHHHHVPKLLWIAASLFIAFSVVCMGWFNTDNKLDNYIANDTKYRYLKLDTANAFLQSQLFKADTLLSKNASFRETVINLEEEYCNNNEMIQKANRMNIEAEKLKANAKQLKEKARKK
jgi:hypothetical protein